MWEMLRHVVPLRVVDEMPWNICTQEYRRAVLRKDMSLVQQWPSLILDTVTPHALITKAQERNQLFIIQILFRGRIGRQVSIGSHWTIQ